MKAFITQILPLPRAAPLGDRIQLQWDLEEVDESGVFGFDVERSGASEGPWTSILTGDDIYSGYDELDKEAANILSLARDIYYRVKVTPPSGSTNTIYSPIMSLEGHAETCVLDSQPAIGYRVSDYAQHEPDPQTNITTRPVEDRMEKRLRLLRRKILRDQYILLKKFNGIEYLLLKRRHFGVRCPDCYNPSTREVLHAHCPTCHGTGWQEGFFNPVTMLGRRLASQIQTDISPQTKDDINMTRIQLQNFPRIDEGDILVEKYRNKRFLVKQRYFTTLKTIPIHQTVTVSELERQSKEYDISVSL